MSGCNHHFKPYTATEQNGKPREGCMQCGARFNAGLWPRSKWTLSGFSPWCPQCHAKHAPHKPQRKRPGPKPKGRQGGWTNMPI